MSLFIAEGQGKKAHTKAIGQSTECYQADPGGRVHRRSLRMASVWLNLVRETAQQDNDDHGGSQQDCEDNKAKMSKPSIVIGTLLFALHPVSAG